MTLTDTLRTQRTNVRNQQKELLDTAIAAKRDFTAKEQSTYDSLCADDTGLTANINRENDRAAEDRSIADAFARINGTPVTGHNPADGPTVDAFRSAILEKNPAPIMVRSANPRSYYSPGVERRDLLKTGPANFQPVSFYDRIIETMVETSAVLNAGATLITTTTGEDLRVPRSTANGAAGIVAEGAAIPESDPSLGVVTLGAYKYALLIQVSSEMVADTTVDLQAYIAREAGTAIGVALGNHLINGTGSGQPRGVLADATVGVTGPVGTATSFGTQSTAGQGTDLLNNLYGSLAEPYTQTGSTAFLARNATVTAIRNLKASSGELVGNSYVSSSPAPFLVDPSVPSLAANAKSVLFGDWSRYFLRMVNGIRFDRSDDFAFSTDMVTFRILLRADGALIDPSAIKYLANSAT